MERLFLNLKMERAWQRDYANHGQAQADVAGYIVGFCNRPIGPSEIIRTMTDFLDYLGRGDGTAVSRGSVSAAY